MTKKLLISNDTDRASKEIINLESKISILNDLTPLFYELDLGTLDSSTALTLLSDKGTTAGEMFLTAIATNAMAMGNVNKHFVNQQVKGQEDTVKNFKTEVKRVLDSIGTYFDFSNYSYSESDGYYISDETKNLIFERNKIYLDSQKEVDYYNAVKTVCDSIDTLNNLTIERTGRNHLDIQLGEFGVGGFQVSRFNKEVLLLEKLIDVRSEEPKPDPTKIVQFLKTFQ